MTGAGQQEEGKECDQRRNMAGVKSGVGEVFRQTLIFTMSELESHWLVLKKTHRI